MPKYQPSVVAALTRIIAATTFNLVKGYKLTDDASDGWGLLDPRGDPVLLVDAYGETNDTFIMVREDDEGVASVYDTGDLGKTSLGDLKRQGIGSSAYKALAKHYGVLRSSPEALSTEADKLWMSFVRQGIAKLYTWDLDLDDGEIDRFEMIFK